MMMRMLTLILFYIQLKYNLSETLTSSTCDGDREIIDYYWRDYNCVIPEDAVPGGIDINGNITYIGQVFHGEQLIPAEIHPEEKVVYEWAWVAYTAHKHIKILCSTNKNQFEWVSTGNQLINKIKDKHFIIGGFEKNTDKSILIGRKLIDGEFVIGKVIFEYARSVLVTTKDGKGIHHEEFDVLSHRGLKQQEKANVQENTYSCNPTLLKTVVINNYG